MNYFKIYSNLIRKRRQFPLNHTPEQLIQYHHIIPKCIGGKPTRGNKNNNIIGSNVIGLTFKEHVLAHKLLVKIFEQTKYAYKLAYIIKCMKITSHAQFIISKQCLENAILYSSQIHKGIPLSIEHKKKISQTLKGKKKSKSAVIKSANSKRGQKRSLEFRQKMSRINKGRKIIGRKATNKTKMILSLAQKGKKHISQNFLVSGRILLHNGIKAIYVEPQDVFIYVNLGFIFAGKITKNPLQWKLFELINFS